MRTVVRWKEVKQGAPFYLDKYMICMIFESITIIVFVFGLFAPMTK